MPRNIRQISICMLLIGMVIIVSMGAQKTYYVRDNANADILWDTDEAYLFIRTSVTGYRLRRIGYPYEMLREHLGIVRNPDNKRHSLLIFKIRPRMVTKYIAEDVAVSGYVPVDNAIYMNTEGVPLKWTGDHLEPANRVDSNRLSEVENEYKPGFSNVRGWSEDYGILNRGTGEQRFSPKVSSVPVAVTVAVSPGKLDQAIQITLSNGTTDRIWSLDGRPKKITRAEYQDLFPSK